MKKIILFLCSIAGAFALVACDDEVGGPCRTVEYPGRAVIVSVTADTSRFRTCENGAVILFDFKPTDPSAPGRYHFPSWLDTNRLFMVGSGCTPPMNWAISQGLTVGGEHRCVRWETIGGTCTPSGFRFPGIDYSAWGDSCDSR